MIRRFADAHSDEPDTLWWLLERIRNNSAIMSRSHYVETSSSHDEDPRRADAEFTSR